MDWILNNLVYIFIFIIGLCLGSFYNVVILRSLSGESIVFPASKCPKCGTKLKPQHNIPVLSYILLKGKCAFCHEKISIQYPIVELLTAVLFCLAFSKFGYSYTTLFVMFWISCLVIMTGTDIKEKVADCNYAIALAVSGLIYLMLKSGLEGLASSVIGAAIGFVIIELIARVGQLLKKGRAMGEADSYLAGAFGAIVGYQHIHLPLFYALIASMLVILPIFWYRKYKDNDILCIFLSAMFIMSIAIHNIYPFQYWTFVLVLITGTFLAYHTIKNLKESSNLSYFPFIPALSTGFLYYILFVLRYYG